MNCPVCSKRHNKYPIICITSVQNRYSYAMLARREPSPELQELYDNVCKYDKYWKDKEG